MASGTIVIFDSAKHRLGLGTLNLSQTFAIAVAHSASYTPNIDDSTFASASLLLLSGNAQTRAVGVGVYTKTAEGVLKFDLSDVNLTATSGVNLSAKWAVLFAQNAAAATVSYVPVMYFDLSTAGEVVAAQISISFPAEGLFETSDNV